MSQVSRVRELGREAGFDMVRIAPAEPLREEGERYAQWIEDGRQAEMRWITPPLAARSADPRTVLDAARSVICVGMSYWASERQLTPKKGKVARYAWGEDYHRVLGERMRALAARLKEEMGGDYRWYADAGPLMEKALAARSGLGWYGKNTNILTERFGSYVLLGEIVTTLYLPPDPPLNKSCGSCRMCIVACPTGALGPEYSIDSRRCISYLTIELRGSIPRDLREPIGAWVFGCDICQDVCPPTMVHHLDGASYRSWAAEVRRTINGTENTGSGRDLADAGPASEVMAPLNHPLFSGPLRQDVDLLWLLQLTHDEYVEAFRGTAIKRAKAWMLRRNAAVALGNVGGTEACSALTRAMMEDEHPVVRGHAAWALAHASIRTGARVDDSLQQALVTEKDEDVRAEIELALAELH